MKRGNVKTILFASALALCALSGASLRAAPSLLTYQGRLQEAGAPVTGARNVEISVCDAITAGNCYSSGIQGVSVFNGLFRSTFTDAMVISNPAAPWFLQISVGPAGGGVSPLTPREQLTSTWYAHNASSVSAVGVSAGVLGADVVASQYYRKPALRYSRTGEAYNAADATKDTRCSSEFGSTYAAANLCDVALVVGGRLGSGVIGGSTVGRDFNVRDDATKSYSVNPGAAGSGIVTKAGATLSVSCISAYAAVRFTSTLIAYTAADGVKDGQCTSEFGSSYAAANILDLAALGGSRVDAAGGPALSASDNSFNIAGNTTHSWAFEGSTLNSSITINAATGGTYRIACIRQ